jgi:hypothetical protein
VPPRERLAGGPVGAGMTGGASRPVYPLRTRLLALRGKSAAGAEKGTTLRAPSLVAIAWGTPVLLRPCSPSAGCEKPDAYIF